MKCSYCKEPFAIKITDEWITLMCKCKCIIIYPDTFIVRKEKKDYDPNYKEREN